MQHAYSDFPRSQQEYERSHEERFAAGYRSRIDAGEKILPVMPEKRRVHRLGLRLILALASLLVLISVCVAIILSDTGQFPDLTNLNLVFAIFTAVSINLIANLLLDRAPGKPKRKGIVRRLIFAVVTGLLTPAFCWMMIEGVNGLNGILLVLVIAVSVNIISYLTLCKKRRNI